MRTLVCTLLLLSTPARAATIVFDEAAHAALLADDPGAGAPFVVDFEDLQLGVTVAEQYAAQGLHLASPDALVVLPEAFGADARGTQLAVVGFDPEGEAELVVSFDEPQFVLSGWFVDGEGDLLVEAFLGGVLADSATMDVDGEGIDGGVFRALWFDAQVDEIHFLAPSAEDGFGIDDLAPALPGTVDNDGDGVVEVDGDCDDTDAAVWPGAADDCDGVDSDCDGVVDDLDDGDGDGVAACNGDCDDGDASVHPGATELCDGVDQDCDGLIDEGDDGDGDGLTACEGDCDDSDPTAHPGAQEVCDGVDNDCDGLVDESPDSDGDGWTVCGGDCDDEDPTVFPGEGCDPPGDDDDAGSDDDDAGSDDDDAGSDDDDAGSDDDDAGSDDDDAGSDDDDAGSDDDDAGSDDDDAGSDDDDAGSDDDDAGSDDDDPSAAAAAYGIAGGGCSAAGGLPLPLFLLLVRRRR